ncbi:hypothetical protein PAL_GLEAN10024310 [Pteropus alecto]|uniref:Uncharacterized protein n=1 Tax=Pteropus alecto TaxID=9402 RepID=L5JXI2_PTEAL|nr:hypothetical protein PAL_GLEAN10024310 [Pteropus alecto]
MGPRPACHPAPCHPFLKHLLMEATGSRTLCHGSQAWQSKASIDLIVVGGVGTPLKPCPS